MMLTRRYYMLLGSLPALPGHFEDAERVPLTGAALGERIRTLDDDAGEVLQQMADFLVWDRQPPDHTDEHVCRHYEDFMQRVQNRFARRCIDEAMMFRTIISSLRRRRLGMDTPVGVGRLARHIEEHWSHPDFRLGMRVPWIAEVDAQLNGKSPLDLERTLLNIRWTYAKRLADQHHFTFEAVVLYLIRWEIVFRWVSRDAAAGREKFERLVAETMGKYATIFQPHEADHVIVPHPAGVSG